MAWHGAAVRGLVSHQCKTQVGFRPNAICGLNLFLFSPCFEGFSPAGFSGFFSLHKINISNSNSTRLEEAKAGVTSSINIVISGLID